MLGAAYRVASSVCTVLVLFSTVNIQGIVCKREDLNLNPVTFVKLCFGKNRPRSCVLFAKVRYIIWQKFIDIIMFS